MVGGNAINWFMPKNAYDWSNKVVGNPDGYNVLDFSLNGWGVDIVVKWQRSHGQVDCGSGQHLWTQRL